MAAVGGSLESLTIDGREFPVTADVEAQRKLGGWENEMLANGDGTARQKKTRVPWSLEGVVVEVDDSRGDHEFLQERADGFSLFPCALTYASGITYQGEGQIVGDLQASSQEASAAVSLMGSGKLTKQ